MRHKTVTFGPISILPDGLYLITWNGKKHPLTPSESALIDGILFNACYTWSAAGYLDKLLDAWGFGPDACLLYSGQPHHLFRRNLESVARYVRKNWIWVNESHVPPCERIAR